MRFFFHTRTPPPHTHNPPNHTHTPVLDEARKRGLRLLLVLTDQFADGAGGALQFMSLAGEEVDEGVEGQKSYQVAQWVLGLSVHCARACTPTGY